jgi:hypothetical protein
LVYEPGQVSHLDINWSWPLRRVPPDHPGSMPGVAPPRLLLSVRVDQTFVPPAFDVPTRMDSPWFEGRSWPHPMTLEENLGDLAMHARDFRDREGLTYTVLDPDRDAIGCVYIYPADDDERDARVLSWVRSSQRELDPVLWREVSGWLERDWPFERVAYAPRG